MFSFECTDSDECLSVETNECDPNAWCTNTEGSYSCRCIRGFEGDGTNCTGKNKKKTIRNISAKDILGAVHGILNWSSVMLVTRVLLSRERSVV